VTYASVRSIAACLLMVAASARAEETGQISGLVRLQGNSELAAAPIDKDQAVCGRQVPDDTLRVAADGGLADVAIWLATVPADRNVVRSRHATLRLTDCRLEPHVIALSQGQILELQNGDPLPHRLEAFLEGEETLFRVSLPFQNQVVPKRMKRSGIVRIRCVDGHSWASAIVVVQPHRYLTLSARDGSFALADVPPGTHQLVAWHELMGERRATVEVRPSVTARAEFSFRRP